MERENDGKRFSEGWVGLGKERKKGKNKGYLSPHLLLILYIPNDFVIHLLFYGICGCRPIMNFNVLGDGLFVDRCMDMLVPSTKAFGRGPKRKTL